MIGRKTAWHNVATVILSLYCLITVALFYVIIVSSVKSYKDVLTNIWGLPKMLDLSNFVTIFKDGGFDIYVKNSVLITFISLATCLYIASITAYGIRMFGGRAKSFMNSYFLIGLMFPAQLGIVPLFILVRNLGLKGTIFSVILIYTASISFPFFMLSGFLNTIPGSLIESAKIDGAKEITIFHKIVMPLMKPIYGSLIPLIAISTWNDFFFPLVFLTKKEAKTIPIGLLEYYYGQFVDMSKLSLMFTAATVSILPIFILYLMASDRIVAGIASGAIKQ